MAKTAVDKNNPNKQTQCKKSGRSTPKTIEKTRSVIALKKPNSYYSFSDFKDIFGCESNVADGLKGKVIQRFLYKNLSYPLNALLDNQIVEIDPDFMHHLLNEVHGNHAISYYSNKEWCYYVESGEKLVKQCCLPNYIEKLAIHIVDLIQFCQNNKLPQDAEILEDALTDKEQQNDRAYKNHRQVIVWYEQLKANEPKLSYTSGAKMICKQYKPRKNNGEPYDPETLRVEVLSPHYSKIVLKQYRLYAGSNALINREIENIMLGIKYAQSRKLNDTKLDSLDISNSESNYIPAKAMYNSHQLFIGHLLAECSTNPITEELVRIKYTTPAIE